MPCTMTWPSARSSADPVELARQNDLAGAPESMRGQVARAALIRRLGVVDNGGSDPPVAVLQSRYATWSAPRPTVAARKWGGHRSTERFSRWPL